MSIAIDQPAATLASKARSSQRLSVGGLFAGIGGIELGLHAAGHHTELLCEIDEAAQRVLRAHFPEIELVADVRSIKRLPEVDIVTGGFPCQDLSQAGRTAGIEGQHSGLVSEVFRLLADEAREPKWLVLENVPFMLQLDRGNAMRYLVDSLEALGFSWAYRVIDTRSFGLPQRRKRVIFVACRTDDPRTVLFADDAGERDFGDGAQVGCGFYWTEGIRGLGWAVDAVPTLKGGSGLGIPSPPAIRLPDEAGVVLPEIRDAERLQGFKPDWTLPGLGDGRREGPRWKMVGNAVSVPVFEWVGQRLADPGTPRPADEAEIGSRWPTAAYGLNGERRSVALSAWPVARPYTSILDFLGYPTRPLSERATAGFLGRTKKSTLRFPPGFIHAIEAHLARIRPEAA